jgi:hypothetical protein
MKNKILSSLALILTAVAFAACGKSSSSPGSGTPQGPAGPGPGGSISDYTAYCSSIGGVIQAFGGNTYCRVQRTLVNGYYSWNIFSSDGSSSNFPQILASNPPTRIGPIFTDSTSLTVAALDRVTFKGRLRWDTGSNCNLSNHSSPMLASDGVSLYNLGSNNTEQTTVMTTSGQLYLGFAELPLSDMNCGMIEISKLIVHHCEDSNRQTISCP